MDRVEKRLDATLKIVQTGMKMLVKMEKENSEFRKETREAIHALIEAQMRTDAVVFSSNETTATGRRLFSGGSTGSCTNQISPRSGKRVTRSSGDFIWKFPER